MNPPFTSLLLAAGIALVAPTASAQQTWIVDIDGGPGSHFTQIAEAVAAASPGDEIDVRPGNYVSFTVNKGLRILGEDNVLVQGGFFCVDLPPGFPAVFQNLDPYIGDPGTQLGFQMRNNDAPVHLDDVNWTSADGLVIDDCVLVTLRGCALLSGAIGVGITDSNVHFDGCLVQGLAVPAGAPSTKGAALECTNSTVHLGATALRGASAQIFQLPTQGISMVSGKLVLGSGSSVKAGTDKANGNPVAAIRSTGGTIVIDANVTLTSTGGSADITGPVVVQNTIVPAVVSNGGIVGGSMTGTTYAPAGSLAVTFIGTPAGPAPTPWGELWLGGVLLTIDAGTVPAGGSRPLALMIPATVPAGLTFSLQAVAVVAGRLYLSTPSATSLGL